ncbi:MAG: CBS domain-containing protein [Anaerolineales bacterium]|jgi:acetoin utilization protein AcuB
MAKVEWITTREAAERLGVTTARVRQMVAENQLEAMKIGGKYRGQWQIKARDIEERIFEKGEKNTMIVKNWMTRNPITAAPKTNYNQALRLMEQNHISHLPILNERGDLIGIVARGDMLRAEPSPVSTLSIYEIASLLDKVTMEKIMTKPVRALDENCSITNAARFMLEHELDCFPVMREGKLVGIITYKDIFKTFVEITGGTQAGSRIEARMPDQRGQLAPFVQALTDAGSFIVSVAITRDESSGYAHAEVKERGGDEEKMRAELEKLPGLEVIAFRPSDDDKVLSFPG